MFAGIDDPRPASLGTVRRDRLFSAVELRNDIRLLETAYAEFDLAGLTSGRPPRSYAVCRSWRLMVTGCS
jgi:hypothetical protein